MSEPRRRDPCALLVLMMGFIYTIIFFIHPYAYPHESNKDHTLYATIVEFEWYSPVSIWSCLFFRVLEWTVSLFGILLFKDYCTYIGVDFWRWFGHLFGAPILGLASFAGTIWLHYFVYSEAPRIFLPFIFILELSALGFGILLFKDFLQNRKPSTHNRGWLDFRLIPKELD